MQSTPIGWIAFVVLAGLISVSSCQAWRSVPEPTTAAGAK